VKRPLTKPAPEHVESMTPEDTGPAFTGTLV
jgi:hypothetical protein